MTLRAGTKAGSLTRLSTEGGVGAARKDVPSTAQVPMPGNSFVGRTRDLGALTRRLARSRLVTLTGPAGIGKTRLAMEAIEHVGHRYPDGVTSIGLATIADPALVIVAVAQGMGLWPGPRQDVLQLIVAHARKRRLLLVLDNCEHVPAPCGELVAALIGACPDVTVLATSQASFGIAGERVMAVPTMTCPPEGAGAADVAASEAGALFGARAAVAHQGFVVTEQIASAVVQICRRLDGIPLAIELAASRVAVIAPAEIVERLEDRFAVLTGGSRVMLDRHETLRQALDWSYDLLPPSEQRLLFRLSVFVGSCSLGATQSITGMTRQAVMEAMGGLVAKSLVVAERKGPRTRYRLLETIRAYGLERLREAGEMAGCRRLHARWCLALAEHAEPLVTGKHQLVWLDALEADHDNLLAALEWAVGEEDGEIALRLSGALVIFWRVRGRYREGRRWLEAALTLADGRPAPMRAKALWGAGFLAHMLDDEGAARPLLEEGLALAGEAGHDQAQARALLVLGNLASDDPALRLELLTRSASAAERASDHWCLAHALALSAPAHLQSDDRESARRALEESIRVAHRNADHQSLCMVLYFLGRLSSLYAYAPSAERLAQIGLRSARLLRDPYAISAALNSLGEIAVSRSDKNAARGMFEEGLAVSQAAQQADVENLVGLGEVAIADGDMATARRHLEEAAEAAHLPSQRLTISLALGRIIFAEANVEGARRLYQDAIEMAILAKLPSHIAAGLEGLAIVARKEGDTGRAFGHLHDALSIYQEIASPWGVAESLEGLAGVATQARRFSQGARLLGASAAAWAPAGRRSTLIRSPLCDVAALERNLGPARISVLFDEGKAMTIGQAVAYARRPLYVKRASLPGSGTLTRAERAVASLAASGLSNPQIAERLWISRNTVQHHLTHIFAKLGIASRSHLAKEGATPRSGTRTSVATLKDG